jgi:hypothetical protein
MLFNKFRQLTGFRGRVHQRVHYSLETLERPTDIETYERVVVTFDPKLFVKKQQQCFSIGNILTLSIRFMLDKQSVIVPRISYSSYAKNGSRFLQPYPPDTKGFLYYARLRGRPRIAGELRFRVTSSDNPAYFACGSDLLGTTGQPWSRPLFVLPAYYPAVYEKLREDKLVPDDLHAILSGFPKRLLVYSRSQCIFTLNDPFIIDFAQRSQLLFVVTEKGMENLQILALFSDKRITSLLQPYKGT